MGSEGRSGDTADVVVLMELKLGESERIVSDLVCRKNGELALWAASCWSCSVNKGRREADRGGLVDCCGDASPELPGKLSTESAGLEFPFARFGGAELLGGSLGEGEGAGDRACLCKAIVLSNVSLSALIIPLQRSLHDSSPILGPSHSSPIGCASSPKTSCLMSSR